ncbi:MAG: 2-C-methyl-D-erythritol 4-phosphate cytidylyltransferase [Lachnospiraceae bacterium]|nr:2-C-methyl-D-erythritol 4-phosphate cytidylyltransferase [Lachnospiraceae bacterium]
MNIALIFAGGTGQRMNTKTTPKQFLKLHEKEIIIYTIEHFENHPDIDAIVVSCIAQWIPYLKSILKRYGIKKVEWIVEGGSTGQQSIYNALEKIEQEYPEESIVLIHDGVRPLINDRIISENIECVKKSGAAITVAPSVETVITIKQDGDLDRISDRSACMMAKAPQSFYVKDIISAHKRALQENKNDFIDSASIMSHYGYQLKTVVGGYENIKITTPSDFYIFRAIIEAKENSQIFGI